MRYLILIFLLVVMTMSCDPTKAYRPQIETLSKEWKDSDIRVREAFKSLQGNIGSVQALKPSMQLSPEVLKTKSEAEKRILEEMKLAFDTQIEGLAGLTSTADQFMADWNTNSQMMSSLEQALENKKFENDPEATIQKLNDVLLGVDPVINNWKTKSEGALNTATAAYRNMFPILFPHQSGSN